VGAIVNLTPTEHWDYSFADMFRGLLAAVSLRESARQSHIHVSDLGQCLAVRSGRAGIVLALKALSLPSAASVGVPLYCCPVVLKAIKTAGYRPRFIDVDSKTYCLSASDLSAKSSEVDAVIAVHMFGNTCDMPALRAAAPGKPFLEDCAQAIGSRFDDRAAGSFGEIAVFSFRSGKYLSVGEGGALYSKEQHHQARLQELVSELPKPGRAEEGIHVVNTWLRSLLRTKPLWGMVGNRLWEFYCEKVSYSSQSPVQLGKIYETDRTTVVRRLPALPSFIDQQRSNAAYYSQNLEVDPDMLCFESAGAFFNRLQYPLLVPSPGECHRLVAALRDEQISTARPYKDIVEIATTYYGYHGDCPVSERIARTVLVIPCNYGLGGGEVERITSCVNRSWSRVRDRQEMVSMEATHQSSALRRSNTGEGIAKPQHSSL